MDIFIINISSVYNIETKLLKEFQKKEISNLQKWQQHCFSYLMIDKILKNFYNLKNREIIFEEKKPYLKTKKKFFSISHGGNYIALAFSDYECGIDIEKIKDRDYKEISKRMGFQTDSLEDFYNKWTKYEAEYKLGNFAKSLKWFNYEDYAVTAVSENIQENFEIYIQNKENFPNAVV